MNMWWTAIMTNEEIEKRYKTSCQCHVSGAQSTEPIENQFLFSIIN